MNIANYIANHPDAALLVAYGTLLGLKQDYFRRVDDAGEEWTAEQDDKWDELEQAQVAIIDEAEPQTIAGVTVILEENIHRLDQSRQIDRTVTEHGAAALLEIERLDWGVHVVAKAIVALKRIEADQIDEGLRRFGEAWIDRWQAIGGTFNMIRSRDGKPTGVTMGKPAPNFWTPPAEQNPALKPHQWITSPEEHRGATKMLDGLLELIPGGRETVLSIAAERGLILGQEG